MLIGYVRVSTDRQSLSLQRDALGKYVSAAGERVDPRNYFEDVASGATMTGRPELQKALEYAQPGDSLVVWKLDRLGRSVKDLVLMIDDLAKRGISVVSLTEQLDTSTPAGKLLLHVFAVLAEFERDTMRERVKAGLKSAADRGRVGGRPRKLTDAKTREIAGYMTEKGVGYSAAARLFNVNVTTLRQNIAALPTDEKPVIVARPDEEETLDIEDFCQRSKQ